MINKVVLSELVVMLLDCWTPVPNCGSKSEKGENPHYILPPLRHRSPQQPQINHKNIKKTTLKNTFHLP